MPNDEIITFRSVTLAEVYIGQAADSLTTALGTIECANFRRPIMDDIAEARQGDRYLWGTFRLTRCSTMTTSTTNEFMTSARKSPGAASNG